MRCVISMLYVRNSEQAENLFHCELFKLLVWNFLVLGCTRRVTCMFIIKENFGAFLLWHLLHENNLGYLNWSFTVYNQVTEYAATIRHHIYSLYSFWHAYDLVEIPDVWCNCKWLTCHCFFIHCCACFVTGTAERISEDLHWSWSSNNTLMPQPCSVRHIRIYSFWK